MPHRARRRRRPTTPPAAARPPEPPGAAVTAFATASRVRSARRACSSPRSFEVPATRPRSSTARNVTRRCGGTRSRSKSDGSTGAYVSRRMACARTAGNGVACRSALRAVGQLGGDLRGPVGGGHDVAADRLRQGPQHRRDELVAQAGHLPVEAGRLQPGEQGERHDDGHAVVVGARLEAVGERERWSPCRQRSGNPSPRSASASSSTRSAPRHREQVGASAVLAAPPAFEGARVRDVRRDPRLVERDDGLVADEDVAAPRALLDLAELAAQLAVRAVERGEPLVEPARVPVALDEGVADEQLAREHGVEPGELHAPLRHDRHAEQRDLLVGDGRALPPLPVRLAVTCAWRGRPRAARPTPGRSRRSCGRTGGSSRPARRS